MRKAAAWKCRLALVAAVSLSAPALASAQVVVEEVDQGLPGERSGLRPGDLVVSWTRARSESPGVDATRGVFSSAFDFADVETEQGPRGSLILHYVRGSQRLRAVVPTAPWGLRVRPRLSAATLAAYEEGQTALRAGEVARAVEAFERAASEAQRSRAWVTACWLRFRRGQDLARARSWDEAQAAFDAALSSARAARLSAAVPHILGARADAYDEQNDYEREEAAYQQVLRLLEKSDQHSLALASALSLLGLVVDSRGDLARSEELHRRALAIQEGAAPASLAIAKTLIRLGDVVRKRGDLDAAEPIQRRSAALLEKIAPESRYFTVSLNNLAVTLMDRGDLDGAEALFERCLAIQKQRAPESLETSQAIVNLGNVAYYRGDLAAAQELYKRALVLDLKRAPDSLGVQQVLNNLGAVAANRGDYAAAEDYFRKALELFERRAPESPTVAMLLANLGNVAQERGDSAAAEEFLRRSLALREKQSAGSPVVAQSLASLGNVLRDRGAFAEAERMLTRSLEIREALGPNTREVAVVLQSFGQLAMRRGNVAEAEPYFRRALAICERELPGSIHHSSILHSLGDVLASRGELSGAAELYTRALEIRQRLAPGTWQVAETLHSRGTVYRRMQDGARAAEDFRAAVEALESQTGRLGGGDEARSGFATRYAGFYRDYMQALVDSGRPETAFHVLERSRARSLLALLAERDVVFSADLPAELERERRLLQVQYDRTQAEIEQLDPSRAAEQITGLIGRLRRLRDRREQLALRVREVSPRFASLQYPQPLDLIGAQSALDPGTLLLAYSVAKDSSILFAVRATSSSPAQPALSVFRLAVGEEVLRDQVESMRNLIRRGPSAALEPLAARAEALYDVLLRPAERLIETSERLLIVPDGPLHVLPFGSLVEASKPGRNASFRRYLAEWKSVHAVVSTSVYAELKKSRRENGSSSEVRVAAFGDPRYPTLVPESANVVPESVLRSALRRGLQLSRLPASRDEVEAIAALFPGTAVRYLGEEATETRAKTLGRDVTLVHFACHGALDETSPLDSALVLTIPEPAEGSEDNGLLQAWEIFEQVRIDADLVTLSACETGLGKEMGGEGLVGLTRAFQYAGARSILASLWSVSDESSAELMKRFYGHLKSGKTKGTALQEAQRDLIHAGGRFGHPFHWAGFQLIGDWR